MRISKQAQAISKSPTLTLNDQANKLRQAGKPIIHLGIGEPQNPAPSSAIHHTQKRLNTRQIKYAPTAGTQELKTAVQQYTTMYYGRTPALDNIIITVGAKQALANIMVSLLDPGDEVILNAPYWVSYPEMVKLAYGNPVVVSPGDQLIPSFKNIQEAVTEKTKMVLLNSPNNPSGVMTPPDIIEQLVCFCEEEGIHLVMDDIYHQLTYHNSAWVPGYSFTRKSINESSLIVVNGVSKTYGMTGFRIGWTVGPSPLIQTMAKIQGQTTSGASILLQDAALGALRDGKEDLIALQETMQDNRASMLQQLKRIPEVQVPDPGGAFYVFPDFSAYEADSVKLAKFLLQKAFVVTIPGSAFGMEGHLRMSYTCPPEQITESIQRIRWALDPDSPRTIDMGGKTYERTWLTQRG